MLNKLNTEQLNRIRRHSRKWHLLSNSQFRLGLLCNLFNSRLLNSSPCNNRLRYSRVDSES